MQIAIHWRFLPLVLTGLSVVARDRVAWDLGTANIRSVGIVGQINTIEFRKEALRLLAPAGIHAGTLTAYPTDEDRHKFGGRDLTDCTYETWVATLQRLGFASGTAACPPIQEALKVGKAAAIRRVSAACIVETEPLLDGNPISITFDGSDYTLLEMIIGGAQKSRKQAAEGLQVSFYVQSRVEVTTARAAALLSHLREVTRASDILVSLRNDKWFPTNCEFPVRFVFGGPDFAIPDRTKYLRGMHATCVAFRSWPVRCY